MRRFFALVLACAGLSMVAAPASAQSSVIAPLPSGVTLRINGPGSNLTGVLYQQSVDSIWLRPRGGNQIPRSIATSLVKRVDQAQPEYTKSILVGTGLGVLLGAALYAITPKRDHDLFVGLSVITGATAGILFPHTDWVPVPLH